jgi:hypothetical protein
MLVSKRVVLKLVALLHVNDIREIEFDAQIWDTLYLAEDHKRIIKAFAATRAPVKDAIVGKSTGKGK